MNLRLTLAAVLLAGCATAAQAQTPGGPSSGPLVLQPIESRFVVAPEYKFTDVDGRSGHMAGFTAGVLTDRSLYLGGALYFLTNGSHDFGLTYGGLLTGWTTPVGAHLRVGGRALLGVGTATLGDTITTFDPRRRVGARTVNLILQDDFLVAEPQAQAHLSIADHVGVDVTGGYRFTGYEQLRNGADGATGSVGLQIGW